MIEEAAIGLPHQPTIGRPLGGELKWISGRILGVDGAFAVDMATGDRQVGWIVHEYVSLVDMQ